jgi:hypothetical protein
MIGSLGLWACSTGDGNPADESPGNMDRDASTSAGGNGGDSDASTATPSACDGETFFVEEGFLFDFENQPLQDSWYSFADETEGAEKEDLAPEPGGAVGTATGARFSGEGYDDWGAGTNLALGCWDVSDFDGVSFWAKGTDASDIDFQVALPETHAVDDGGDCEERCFDHPRTTITLSDEWTQFVIPWDELEQEGWGTAAEFRGLTMGLLWTTSGPDFDYWIDEIAFYSGSAPEGAVRTSGGWDLDVSTPDTDDAGMMSVDAAAADGG